MLLLHQIKKIMGTVLSKGYVGKPMTNLCLTCPQNTSKLWQTGNLPDREKIECIQAQQEHLNCAKTERSLQERLWSIEKKFWKIWKHNLVHVPSIQQCAIHLTLPSKFTSLESLCSQDRYTLKCYATEGIFSIMCEAIPPTIELFNRQGQLKYPDYPNYLSLHFLNIWL